MWEPERLRIIGSVMRRYGEHLAVGDRVRLGLEGDQCFSYRSTEDAPKGTVVDVTREDGDRISFGVEMDDGEVMRLDNQSIAPDRTWEIDPEYLDTFKQRLDGVKQPTSDVAALEQRIATLETTMATALREMATDLYRASRGKDPKFAKSYADRYDVAQAGDEPVEVEEKASADDRHDFHMRGVTPVTYASTSANFSEANTLSDEE